MNVAIFGLGYVGSVSAACLAAAGHRVTGVDVDPHKLDLIRLGQAPVSEPGLDDLLGRAIAGGQLAVTSDTAEAIRAADVSLVCVGTPSRRNGSVESTYVERVAEAIGRTLADSSRYHVVAVRSTLLPGVLGSRLIPLLEQTSRRQVGSDLGVCVNPEFLREGTAIGDFEKPPFTVVGETDRRAGDTLLAIYQHIDAPVHRLLPDEASMIKYASNNFHALKVAFANEIGALCEAVGVDGQRVMKVFCEDRELNISPRYLRPGFAFGGSCLPKDLRGILYLAKELDVATPMLTSIIPGNDAQIQRVVDLVIAQQRRRVGLIGLSFKVGSDDLRESPFVRLAEALIGKGVPLSIYDPDVAIGNVFGRNRAYVEERLPHVAQLFGATLPEIVADSDVIVVGKRAAGSESLPVLRRPEQTVIDLVGMPELGDCVRPWAGSASRPAERPYAQV